MKKTRFNIYRFQEVGISLFADALCVIACVLNGKEGEFTIKQLERCAQHELMRFDERRYPIAIEIIGDNILHIDMPDKLGNWQTYFRAELVEVTDLLGVREFDFMPIELDEVPTLFTQNPKDN